MDDSTFLLSSLLPTLDFAYETPKELLCEDCGQAAISPWRTRCEHLLCWRCLNEIMRNLQKCPLDGTPIVIGEATLEKEVDESVRKLLVRCPYQKHGCGAMISLGKLTEHMEVCTFLPVYCPKECGLTVSRKDLVQHIISSCPGSNNQQTIHQNGSQTDFADKKARLRDGNAAIVELQCQVQQLSRSVGQLVQEDDCKPTTPVYESKYGPALVKRRPSKVGARADKHKSMSELEMLGPFGERGYLNYMLNKENFRAFPGHGENCLNQLLEMMHSLEQKVEDMDNKMLTEESLNQVAGTLLDRIEVFQRSLRIHYQKLEALELNQKRFEERQARTLEECQRSSAAADGLVAQLEEFSRKLTAQHQAWTRIADHLEKPWLRETCNGTFVWKITDYARRKQRAARGVEVEVYSQPFFTHLYGYKLCMRAYLNGYCDGEGTHLSVYICVMKGPFDELLPWPFRSRFTFYLLDQKHAEKKEHLTLQVDPKKMGHNFTKWCQRPEAERNVGFGIPEFIAHSKLERSAYLQNDAIFLKVVVDLVDGEKK